MAAPEGAPLHPPAMGGKTAWGVSATIASGTADDPEELAKMKKAQGDFDQRTADRLTRLADMDRNASTLLEGRQERKSGFQMGVIKGADEHRKRQEGILLKMQEAKVKKEEELKAKKKLKKQQEKKDKKKEKKRKITSSDEDSSDSASSEKKTKKEVKEEQKKAAEEEAMRKLQELEAKRQAETGKQKEKEAKKKAKEELAVWKAEKEKKQVEEDFKRQGDAQKRLEEASDKRKQEAKKKEVDAAAKKAAEEQEAQKKKEELAKRKDLFDTSSTKKKKEDDASKKAKTASKTQLAGGYKVRDHVRATQDITIRGNLVVMKDTSGTVVGPAESDPTMRVAVDFVKRQDGGVAVLNCVPREIKRG